jgi:SAM-dependent methyltransferase
VDTITDVETSYGYEDVDDGAARAASRHYWDTEAASYQAEHGDFLGDTDFMWSPEGIREADLRLLGDVAGRRVLEVGCGAAQCSRWLASRGARPVAVDMSSGQLLQARLKSERTGVTVPLVQADATRLPFADASVDLACSAFGAVPFVAEPAKVMAEVARVLRPGGRWVFSTTHPFVWCLPDEPDESGLRVIHSYFDRRAYTERSADGSPAYVETHRTIGDRVRDILAAGLELIDIVEPEWPEGETRVWGQWGPVRGAYVPSTAIFSTRKPGSTVPAATA